MKFNYDRVADAIYINVNDEKVIKSKEIANNMVIDLDKNDKLVGIEILNFSFLQNTANLSDLIKNGIPLNIVEATPTIA